MKIEVFKKWNTKLDQPEQKIIESDGYVISADQFELTVDTIQNITYSLSNSVIGEATDLTISFEPKIHIPSDHECFVKYIFPEDVDIT